MSTQWPPCPAGTPAQIEALSDRLLEIVDLLDSLFIDLQTRAVSLEDWRAVRACESASLAVFNAQAQILTAGLASINQPQPTERTS